MVDVTVVGFDTAMAALDALMPRVIDQGVIALKHEMDEVLVESQEIVPVLTEALHDSGFVSDPIQIGDQIGITIGYGGDNGEVYYALLQHETPNPPFSHRTGKSDKFLEIPLMEWTKDGPRRIGVAIQAGMR